MKKILTILTTIFLSTTIWAQSPNKMSYQAVIRNSSDQLLVNKKVGMQISILQGSAEGTAVYTETQTPTTNANGLVSIEFGGNAGFDAIDWSTGTYFIKTETDPAGGTNYSITGTSQLLSVPYALYAKTSGTPGTPGPQGEQGIKGDKGDQGIQGVKGDKGDQGIQGVAGAKGDKGDTGLTGADGAFPDGTAVGQMNYWNGSAWVLLPAGNTGQVLAVNGSNVPVWQNGSTPALLAPTLTALAASNVQAFSATLNGTVNANNLRSSYSFKWGLTTDYENSEMPTGGDGGEVYGASDVAVSKNLLALLPATTYHYRIIGNNAVGDAYSSDMTFTTPAASTLVIEVTNPTTGEIWMDRNLGASQVATISNDEASYGYLYQWGRLSDGHQARASLSTSTFSSIDIPGHGLFILNTYTDSDWRSPQNNNLWQGVSGVNNPCPTGFRIPTDVELNAERLSWISNNANGAFASPLKLPSAGYRNYLGIRSGGDEGSYWSSTVAGVKSSYLTFSYNTADGTNSDDRIIGKSVRCIKD